MRKNKREVFSQKKTKGKCLSNFRQIINYLDKTLLILNISTIPPYCKNMRTKIIELETNSEKKLKFKFASGPAVAKLDEHSSP